MSKPNVLIIAQQAQTQDALKTILAEEYHYLAAHTGIDGVAISRLAHPAVILVEQNLEKFQAIGVCKSLLAHEHSRFIPVLVLAETADVDGELSTLANFKGVVQVPCQAEDVTSKIQAAQAATPAPSKAAVARSGLKRDEPIRVLSIDDSSVVRKLVTMILTAEGFKVSTASDGLEGVNKAKEINPDIILLDFVMPKMNGFQVCRILQKDDKLRQIPVILVTSKGDKVGDKFVDQLGVTGYITKPFQPEELVSKIHQTLESQPAEGAAPKAHVAAPIQDEEAGDVSEAPEAAHAPAPAHHAAPAAPAHKPEAPKAAAHHAAPAAMGPELDHRIKEIVKAEIDALMPKIEKLVVEKLNEYIRRAKKKDA